jgi:predicted 2-oxoglutarate/Fe(II)-dependent dioxygenase YbiX
LHRINKPWLPNFFNIKKYNEGADMGPHVDSSDPTNIEHPVISGVMYLNDNYEGGEINFPNQGVSIKPKAGSVIIFPSTDPYLHHPQKIDYGTKYMVPLFWYKEPF